jgi:esterase/lipase superfamily enzyme
VNGAAMLSLPLQKNPSMQRETTSWFSPSVNKEMPVAVYGHYGFALLLVPTAGADYLEYERFQMMDDLAPLVDSGKVKVFSIDSLNKESWLNNEMDPYQKAVRHRQWNDYVYNEVIPFIKSKTSDETPVYISGASFGALHSANLFFKRPDIIDGFIAMSGVYDLTEYTKGYFDMEVYYNSPCHYLPNLGDHSILEQIRRSAHIHIVTGSGAYEDPNHSRRLADTLYSKGIWYELDIWGEDVPHDWPTWRTMLPHYLHTRF